MKYSYFANVMAHVKFEIEAPDRDTADELAEEKLNTLGWDKFTETGAEIGFVPEDNPRNWEIVARYGDLR